MKNTDRYKTTEERAMEFDKWCKSQLKDHKLEECPRGKQCFYCLLEWLELEADEGEKVK